MRPLHEPAKMTRELRYLLAREQKDSRFAQLVAQIRRLATEFLTPASMLQGAAKVIAYELRRADYVARQVAEFKADEDSDEG